MSPHGEEACEDLIYLNDAYKRVIIDSQGQEEKHCEAALEPFVGIENMVEL